MQLRRDLTVALCLGLLAVGVPAQEAASGDVSVGYLHGLTMGKALVEAYDGENREDFIRGLAEALAGEGRQEGESASEDEIRQAKQSWFNESGLGKKEQSSYAYGYLLGDAHKARGSALVPSLVAQGYLDSLQNEGVAYVSRDQGTAIVTKYQRSQFYKQKKVVARQIREHERAGADFLASNAGQPGVVETESALQYRVLSRGEGPPPGSEDTVLLSVVGRKIDGEMFYDSRVDNGGEPVSIQVAQSLDGWREALVQMSRGAEWELFLPPGLAYGNAGWRGLVDPGETLVYRLKLLDIVPGG